MPQPESKTKSRSKSTSKGGAKKLIRKDLRRTKKSRNNAIETKKERKGKN